ncbi:TPA: CAAX protease, partial [Streptococcus pyogenes]
MCLDIIFKKSIIILTRQTPHSFKGRYVLIWGFFYIVRRVMKQPLALTWEDQIRLFEKRGLIVKADDVEK